MQFTGELNYVDEFINYDYLSNFGKNQLDFILCYFCKRLNISRVKVLGHLASILLLFMPTEEVFSILKIIVDKSHQTEQKQKLRWHIPTTN